MLRISKAALVSVVDKFPLGTTVLLEGANAAQLIRMWTEKSALGQSVIGWSLVWLALVMWFTYYWVTVPEKKLPRYCTGFGILVNSSVVLTVIYFRSFYAG